MAVHPLLRALFRALDQDGVQWCLLRGEGALAAPTGDVDLLISGDHMLAAEEVIFSLGYAALPRHRGSWHRFYLLRDPSSGQQLKLDVVVRLVFGRAPAIASHLESSCLEHRTTVDGVQRLDRTDEFWTVALHCMLDKGGVSERRAAELTALISQVQRPSEGERFVARVFGADAPGALLVAIANGDWAAVAAGGWSAQRCQQGLSPNYRDGPGRSRRLLWSVALNAARIVYPALWRGLGLGAKPAVASVVDGCGVDVAVLDIHRRPFLTVVSMVLPDGERPILELALRQNRFRPRRGAWVRMTPRRLERVLFDVTSQLVPSGAAECHVFAGARAVHGCSHWFILAPSVRLLLAACSMQPLDGVPGRVMTAAGARELDTLRDLSDSAWCEARAVAGAWGVTNQLTELAERVGAR
jgi:hypothetical protein